MSDKPTVRMKTRLNIWLCIPVLLLLIYMIWGIYKVSIKEGAKLKALANSQQLKSTVVPASRGTIYDSNGNVLAQSATVYTIYVDPIMLRDQLKLRDSRIKELEGAIKEEDDEDKIKEYKEELSLSLDSDETFEALVDFLAQELEIGKPELRIKLTDYSSQYIVLKKDIDKTMRDEIDSKLTELRIDGVRGEPNVKRVYPQNSLAANVLGHTDYTGDGVYGLEAYYNDYLSGVDGRVVTAKDKDGN